MISSKFPCGVTNLATSSNGKDSNEELRVFSGAEYNVVGGVGEGFLAGTPYKVEGGVGDGFLGKLYDVDGRCAVTVVTVIYKDLSYAYTLCMCKILIKKIISI